MSRPSIPVAKLAEAPPVTSARRKGRSLPPPAYPAEYSANLQSINWNVAIIAVVAVGLLGLALLAAVLLIGTVTRNKSREVVGDINDWKNNPAIFQRR